jgi:hypothetical protein
VAEGEARDVHDAAGIALHPDGDEGHVRVAGRQRSVAAASAVVAPGEVGQLPPRRRRDEHVACIPVRERAGAAQEPVTNVLEQCRVAADDLDGFADQISRVETELLWARDRGLKVPEYVARAFREAVELAAARQAAA